MGAPFHMYFLYKIKEVLLWRKNILSYYIISPIKYIKIIYIFQNLIIKGIPTHSSSNVLTVTLT